MRPFLDTPHRFNFAKDFEDRCFEQLTEEEARSPKVRRHWEGPIKTNNDSPCNGSEPIPHVTISIPAHTARDENLRNIFIRELRSHCLRKEETYLIDKKHDLAKMVNYGNHPISTKGTSVPGRLTYTNQVGHCCGVLYAAEKRDRENKVTESKLRVSHVLEFSDFEFAALRGQYEKLEQQGFEVSISIFGGQKDNPSKKDYRNLVKFFIELKSKDSSCKNLQWEKLSIKELNKLAATVIISNRFYKKRKNPAEDAGLLGGVIDELDHTVQRVTQLMTYDLKVIDDPSAGTRSDDGVPNTESVEDN